MVSIRTFAVLFAACSLKALAHSPCDVQQPQTPPPVTEEPCTPVTKAPGLTGAEIAGIAVGAVAGAGAIAGGIAGGMAATESRRRRRRKGGPESSAPEVSAPEAVSSDVVPVVVPVLVPGGNRLYQAEDKAIVAQPDVAAKVGSSTALMGVAAFVFFGFFFLAISGFIYKATKKSSTRVIVVEEDAEALLEE